MTVKEWLNKGYFPVGEGWWGILTKLCKDICKIDETIEVYQIKEKFGGLRFYTKGTSDKIENLIDQACMESFKICEICGTHEDVSTKGSWLLTLCNKCRKRR